jgi:hypothetical protein
MGFLKSGYPVIAAVVLVRSNIHLRFVITGGYAFDSDPGPNERRISAGPKIPVSRIA